MYEKGGAMGNIAIHGFGRIGRSTLKTGLKHGLFLPVCISDVKDIQTLAALFEVDSNYGRWHEAVKVTQDGFVIGGRHIKYFDASRDLPDWKALEVSLVIDCTGRATYLSAPRVRRCRTVTRFSFLELTWTSSMLTGIRS
jgi:glyceraldehyde 3-phosphate dehydrogenase